MGSEPWDDKADILVDVGFYTCGGVISDSPRWSVSRMMMPFFDRQVICTGLHEHDARRLCGELNALHGMAKAETTATEDE